MSWKVRKKKQQCSPGVKTYDKDNSEQTNQSYDSMTDPDVTLSDLQLVDSLSFINGDKTLQEDMDSANKSTLPTEKLKHLTTVKLPFENDYNIKILQKDILDLKNEIKKLSLEKADKKVSEIVNKNIDCIKSKSDGVNKNILTNNSEEIVEILQSVESTERVMRDREQKGPNATHQYSNASKKESKRKCYMIGDSHLRYIHEEMTRDQQFFEKNELQTDFKPGFGLPQILRDSIPNNMEEDNVLIICGGTNDLYVTETDSIIKCIDSLGKLNNKIILISIPPQVGQEANNNIIKLNTLIKYQALKYNNINIINTHSFIKSHHLAQDGIHLGRLAKTWLGKKIVKEIEIMQQKNTGFKNLQTSQDCQTKTVETSDLAPVFNKNQKVNPWNTRVSSGERQYQRINRGFKENHNNNNNNIKSKDIPNTQGRMINNKIGNMKTKQVQNNTDNTQNSNKVLSTGKTFRKSYPILKESAQENSITLSDSVKKYNKPMKLQSQANIELNNSKSNHSVNETENLAEHNRAQPNHITLPNTTATHSPLLTHFYSTCPSPPAQNFHWAHQIPTNAIQQSVNPLSINPFYPLWNLPHMQTGKYIQTIPMIAPSII